MAKIYYTHYEIDGESIVFYDGENAVDNALIMDIVESWVSENPNFEEKNS